MAEGVETMLPPQAWSQSVGRSASPWESGWEERTMREVPPSKSYPTRMLRSGR
jgi:hypothetical protein